MGRMVLWAGLVVFLACGSGGNGNGNDNGNRGDGGIPIPVSVTCEGQGGTDAVAAPVLRDTLAGSWDENWLAAPALVDINGDDKLDIIAARHSVLYAWNHAGTPLWQTAWANSASSSPEHGNSRMWSGPVVGDFDGDGDMEIAVGSDADSSDNVNVAVYDHLGELLPGWPVHFGGSDEVRSITAADIDSDGFMEIIVNKTSTGPTTAVYELSGSMATGWPQVDASCDPPPPAEPCWDFGGYNQNIASGDVDGDGEMDVVSSYDAIGFGIFHGDGSPFPAHESFADGVVTAVEAYHDLALAQQGWGTGDRSEFTSSPPVIADIDGNGDMEIVLAGDHEHSNDTTNQGVSLFVFNHDASRPPGWEAPKDSGPPLAYGAVGNNIVTTHPSIAVANLLDDPGLEMLVPAYDGKLYAYRADGSVAWTYTVTTVATPYVGTGEPLVVDLNRDGIAEVVFTTYTSGAPQTPDTPAHLVVLDAAGVELHKIELYGRGSMAAPSVADLDGDGLLELVVSLKDTLGSGDGGVQIWDLPGSGDKCVLWGTGRGGWLRQGYVPNQS